MLFLSHLFWAVLICLLYIHADCYCRHSQNRYKTDCPTGTRKMWDGFSLAYVQGNGKAHGQELGIVDKIDVFFLCRPFVVWMLCYKLKSWLYSSLESVHVYCSIIMTNLDLFHLIYVDFLPNLKCLLSMFSV